MAKPANSARWANVGGNISEPPEPKKDIGFNFGEEPASTFANWVWFHFGNWITFLYDEMLSPIIDDAGALKADSVTTLSIGASQVTSQKIAGFAVTSSKIGNDNVLAQHINPNVVGAGMVQDGGGALAVNPDDIGIEINGGGDKIQLKDGGVTVAKLAGGGNNLVYGTSGIGASELSQIATAQIFDNAITGAKIATNTITANKIVQQATGVLGRSASSVGDVAAILSPTNDRILSRVANVLGFNQVSTAMLADSIVTNEKTATPTKTDTDDATASRDLTINVGNQAASLSVQTKAETDAGLWFVKGFIETNPLLAGLSGFGVQLIETGTGEVLYETWLSDPHPMATATPTTDPDFHFWGVFVGTPVSFRINVLGRRPGTVGTTAYVNVVNSSIDTVRLTKT